ncbi:DegV family protein [Mycoplasma phocoenae]|uniref:DegV family protein n=1 Tax=Mycoplasma phocoenae TaxID=754517 RepID=A0A858U1P8_9MOLU|nr:DegV family protein [Mycoplasma phocoenae]QJG67044.1 DegV family protein [Mycoplasma phocoenae]
MKIAIVIDSSSGLTEKQANSIGWHYLPIQIEIDGVTYEDGVSVDYSTVFKHIKQDSKVLTSASKLGYAIEMINKLKETHDLVVFYPICIKLSSQYQNIKVAFQDDEKVFIVPSEGLQAMIVLQLLEFEERIKNGVPFEKAIEIFSTHKCDVMLMPANTDALLRGGRLSPAAASMAKLLKIVPIIKLEHGGLEKYGKGRVFEKTILKVAKEIQEKNQNKRIVVLHADNKNVNNYAKQIQEYTETDEPFITTIAPCISVHTGKDAISVVTEYGEKLIEKYLDKLKEIKSR